MIGRSGHTPISDNAVQRGKSRSSGNARRSPKPERVVSVYAGSGLRPVSYPAFRDAGAFEHLAAQVVERPAHVSNTMPETVIRLASINPACPRPTGMPPAVSRY